MEVGTNSGCNCKIELFFTFNTGIVVSSENIYSKLPSSQQKQIKRVSSVRPILVEC